LTERFFAAKRRHSQAPGKNAADLTRMTRTISRVIYTEIKARRSQIREVIDESTACIYPQFFFYPSSSLGNENVREPIASISLTEAKRIRYVGRDGSKLSTIELKKFCSENLPLYMVPDLFCSLESLPKTSTDKIDYQKLKSMR